MGHYRQLCTWLYARASLYQSCPPQMSRSGDVWRSLKSFLGASAIFTSRGAVNAKMEYAWEVRAWEGDHAKATVEF